MAFVIHPTILSPHSAVYEVKCIFPRPYAFFSFFFFLKHSPTLPKSWKMFVIISCLSQKYFLNPSYFLCKGFFILQAGANLSQNISHENGLQLFISTYNKETFV